MQLPQRKSQAFRKYGREDDNFLSAEAIEELKREMDHLEKISRPRTVTELTAAREMGDLSENAAYQMAKGRLAGIDFRLLEIKEKLKNAVVIKPGPDAGGRAKIGSTVVVEVNGRERTFTLTGSQEANPGGGRISVNSPVGTALVGKRSGETAIIDAAGRQTEYRIKEVR